MIRFADCEVYISDYHRERNWQHWLSLADKAIYSVRNEILTRLRRVATVTADYQFNTVKGELLASSVWKNNPSLQKWFEGTWLTEPKVRNAYV